MEQVRVLIADDHEDMLESICDLLEPEFSVVGAVRDGHALVSAAEDLQPDVIVTDISMPQMNGIEAAKEIIRRNPRSKIILITVHNNASLVKEGFAAGVLGYVLKMKASQELSRAVNEVVQGNRYVSPLIKL
ncbi:MAG TPA: response regulator transcription factor [Blastocatellia bacterium]|nr:response regulator transcription factor [Blastocatellia bacterium]